MKEFPGDREAPPVQDSHCSPDWSAATMSVAHSGGPEMSMDNNRQPIDFKQCNAFFHLWGSCWEVKHLLPGSLTIYILGAS